MPIVQGSAPTFSNEELMAYFDPTSDADRALLTNVISQNPPSNLDKFAEKAERAVVTYYTVRNGGRFEVCLDGYKRNPDDVDSTRYPDFVADMRRTVAEVIVWLLAQAKKNPDTVSEFDPGGRSETLRSDRLSHFPPNWDFWLRKYDRRPVTWSL